MPATPYDAKGLLTSAIRDPDPVIFMEPTKLYRSVKEEVPEEQFTVPIGKANIIQEGDDLTVVTWGSYLKEVMDALPKLRPSVELIDLRSISPLDTETIISSVKKTGRCLIVQEAPRSFSVSSEISARITERAFLSLKAPVQRLAGYDLISGILRLGKDAVHGLLRIAFEMLKVYPCYVGSAPYRKGRVAVLS